MVRLNLSTSKLESGLSSLHRQEIWSCVLKINRNEIFFFQNPTSAEKSDKTVTFYELTEHHATLERCFLSGRKYWAVNIKPGSLVGWYRIYLTIRWEISPQIQSPNLGLSYNRIQSFGIVLAELNRPVIRWGEFSHPNNPKILIKIWGNSSPEERNPVL